MLSSPGTRLMLPSIAYIWIEVAEFQEGEEILERRKGIASPAQKPAPREWCGKGLSADGFS